MMPLLQSADSELNSLRWLPNQWGPGPWKGVASIYQIRRAGIGNFVLVGKISEIGAW